MSERRNDRFTESSFYSRKIVKNVCIIRASDGPVFSVIFLTSFISFLNFLCFIIIIIINIILCSFLKGVLFYMC